jgi:hypothetical protein
MCLVNKTEGSVIHNTDLALVLNESKLNFLGEGEDCNCDSDLPSTPSHCGNYLFMFVNATTITNENIFHVYELIHTSMRTFCTIL